MNVSTDILVIGGGIAGMLAALSAKDNNNNVTIISKSKIGKSGNTLVSGGTLSALYKEFATSEYIRKFKDDLFESGCYINDEKLVDTYVNGATSIIETLLEFGVKFKEIDGNFVKKMPPGHSVKRNYPSNFSMYPYHNRGLGLTNALIDSLKNENIDCINGQVVSLKVLDNKVYGALAINHMEKLSIDIDAKVVIIACGGGVNFYEKSNNTSDVSSDSYGMMYDVGVKLRDMEFVQFYPTMQFEPCKITISNPLFGEGAVLRNIHGDTFMKRYSPNADKATRDVMARAIHTEIKEGRGNPKYIYVDCSAIDNNVLNSKYDEFCKYLKKYGINPKSDYMKVSPAAHFMMGGAIIDKNCNTNVDGLLACGEAVGGVHGANRLSGNALSEAVVFGVIAGKNAKKLAVNREYKHIELKLNYPKGDILIADIKSRLKKVMWSEASVIRNEQGLQEARQVIKELFEKLNESFVKTYKDMCMYHSCYNMLVTANMVLEGAINRQESRGAHYRADYLEENKRFEGYYCYELKNDTLKISFNYKGANKCHY